MIEEKLKNYIIEKYGSIRQFSMTIDIPYTTVDSILKRGIDNSNVGNVIKMCKALNISVDNLIDSKEIISNLNFDNANPIDLSNETIQIPVLGTIKAGIPIEAQENIIEYIDIPKDWTRGGKAFYGLQISGDSMFPKYQEKDIVIFEKTEDLITANGKDCAIMVNGFDATFKNIRISQAGIQLIPLNINNSDGYVPTFYDSEQIQKLPIKVIGVAVEKRTKLN